MSNEPERVPAITADELQRALHRTREEAEERLRDKDRRIAELVEAARQWELRYDRLQREEREERKEERKQQSERESKLEEKVEKAQGKFEEDLRKAQEHHREEKSRLEAQLAEAQERNDRLLQAFQESVERERREREAAERNQRDLAAEWREKFEAEQERWAAERARLSGRIQELEARPDALAPAVEQIVALVQKQVTHNSINAALQLLVQEEAQGRQTLTTEEAATLSALEQQQDESLKQVPARAAARAEAVFASRGLSLNELRRTYLGKGAANDRDSYDAGEGLYNLFLALRPDGPVDSIAMRELLKGENNVSEVRYNTLGRRNTWGSKHFAISAGDAYELAACVLCHLPALRELAFLHLPPLSTRDLEWVSHLPQCVGKLRFLHTDYTVADLREMHRWRGSRTFLCDVSTNNLTDWGEFAGVGDDNTKRARVNEALGEMMNWLF